MAIFGVRRLEACRRAGVMWHAEMLEASISDAQYAAFMHVENEWTFEASPLENALQWKAMLDAQVFKNQSALADAIDCHRGRVSRAVRNATVLFGEGWLERLIRPNMHVLGTLRRPPRRSPQTPNSESQPSVGPCAWTRG